jgi:hypothetical protein
LDYPCDPHRIKGRDLGSFAVTEGVIEASAVKEAVGEGVKWDGNPKIN